MSPRMASLGQGNALVSLPYTPAQVGSSGYLPEAGHYGRLQWQRVGSDWETSLSLFTFMHCRRKWQPTPVLISKFDTLEGFWALYNHIQLPSNLMSSCEYSLFKDGIKPMWKDEKNKQGGWWLITLNKQQRWSDLNRFWLQMLLYLIEESFDDYWLPWWLRR